MIKASTCIWKYKEEKVLELEPAGLTIQSQLNPEDSGRNACHVPLMRRTDIQEYYFHSIFEKCLLIIILSYNLNMKLIHQSESLQYFD